MNHRQLRAVAMRAAAVVAGLAAITGAAAAHLTARADTTAGWEAADNARALVAHGMVVDSQVADITMFISAWHGIAAGQGDWLAAYDDPGVTGGVDHTRTDGPALALARIVCGGTRIFTWQVTHSEQPARGDLVLYRPADGGGIARAPLQVGIVISQTQIVVTQATTGGMRAAAVRRELLFHAQQTTAADTPVADAAADVSFCHVSTAYIPVNKRGEAGAGQVRLVDPQEVADTLAWNSAHPRDRDGGGAIVRMLWVFAFIPGAGVGAAAGLVIFGLAAVHDSSDGFLWILTAPFAVARRVVSTTFDGSGIQRALAITLLVLLGFKVLGASFAAGLGIAITAGTLGALQVALDGRFRPFSWLWSAVWAVATYAVAITTGIDGSDHVSIVSVLVTGLGGLAIGVGGVRLLALSGSAGALVRTSAAGRAAVAALRATRIPNVLSPLARGPLAQLAVDVNRGVARFGQTVLGRAGTMLSLRPSAFVPSGAEWMRASARAVGEGVPMEVAPWTALPSDMYSVGLRGFDVASWFVGRPGAWTGDIVSMLGELSDWLAGHLGTSQLTHPWVRHIDALIGHLEPEVRRRVVEVALPALRDASQLSNLHSGGQLAGRVLTGQLSLPTPPATATPP